MYFTFIRIVCILKEHIVLVQQYKPVVFVSFIWGFITLSLSTLPILGIVENRKETKLIG